MSRFQWDEAKNAANIVKHGVSFVLAKRIFDHFVFTRSDPRSYEGEHREISIGLADAALVLAVVHTDRQGLVRIISARRASRRERQQYGEAIRQAADSGRTRGDAG